jgi:hypothetical protein
MPNKPKADDWWKSKTLGYSEAMLTVGKKLRSEKKTVESMTRTSGRRNKGAN